MYRFSKTILVFIKHILYSTVWMIRVICEKKKAWKLNTHNFWDASITIQSSNRSYDFQNINQLFMTQLFIKLQNWQNIVELKITFLIINTNLWFPALLLLCLFSVGLFAQNTEATLHPSLSKYYSNWCWNKTMWQWYNKK